MDPMSWNMVMSMVRLSIIILTYSVTRYFCIFLTIPLMLIFLGIHETLDAIRQRQINEKGNQEDSFQGISIDSFGWVNMIIQEIWATKRLHVEDRVQNQIWPDIVEECNVLCCFGMHWHSITLEKFTLGDIPFEICSIQVWEENQLGDLVFDIEIKYEGNSCATIKFSGEIIKVPMPLTVQNLRIQSAKIRLVLKCVNFERRFVSGIHFGFLEPPQFEWNLSEWNGWHLIPSADKVIISK